MLEVTYRPPRLLGGALCLDFVNTVDPRHGETAQEFLTSYADLLAWSRHVGAVDDTQAESLVTVATAHPGRAVAAHRDAIDVRERLYALLTRTVAGETLSGDALEPLNRCLSPVLAHRRLAPRDRGATWEWSQPDPPPLDLPLWPVLLSAAELLTSADLRRLRLCPGDEGRCGWFFHDSSRAGTRQWCSMSGCGNRAKARRFQNRRAAPA